MKSNQIKSHNLFIFIDILSIRKHVKNSWCPSTNKAFMGGAISHHQSAKLKIFKVFAES